MLDHSGERLSLKVQSRIMVEHLHRYGFARFFTAGKTVLDIASGEGYGSRLLAETAQQVVGVDLSSEAVLHASQQYSEPNLSYLQGDACSLPLGEAAVDVVVSFETIEHLQDQETMIRECKRVLKKEGILIVSTPDKKYYSDIPGYHNPFHVKELYAEEFLALLRRHFSYLTLYRQGILKGGIIYSSPVSPEPLTVFTGDYEKITAGKEIERPEYMLVVASDAAVPLAPLSFFESDAVDQSLHREVQQYRKQYESIRGSTAFRLGKALLSPAVRVRNFFKKKRTGKRGLP